MVLNYIKDCQSILEEVVSADRTKNNNKMAIPFGHMADLVGGCPGTLASSTTKTGRHDIAEILLKVSLKHQK
jgi:hypothetical protein